MEKLFGLPINDVLYGSLGALLFGLLLLTVVALRNRVQFKMGVRNITRRPAQTSLIVLGLMLATLLISAALVTGDTMSYSIKKTALESLGNADIIVKVKGDGENGNIFVGGGKAQATGTYFGKDKYSKLKDALSETKLTDGITPIISEQIPAVSPESRQNVPSITVLGVERSYSAVMGALTGKGEKKLDINRLGRNEAYINAEAADKLSVKKGNEIQFFYGARPHTVKVAGVFENGGRPSSGPAVVMQVSGVQAITGKADRYNTVLVSNKGDDIEGAKLSKKVVNKIKPAIQGTRLEAQTVKEKALKDAEKAASSFTSIFLVFGEFSMAAGVMLIFLIFVMLAAERRSELGTLRALGSKRHDILKIFVFEGTVYAVLAAAVGALLGLGVGWGMVKVMAKAFANMEDTFTLAYHFNPKSLIISYSMGVVTTFLVVFVSAWRAGRVNIVRAIRDIPEPKKQGRTIKSLILAIALVILGAMMIPAGLKAKQAAPFHIGVSFVVVGLPLLARYFRLPERVAFTIAGIGLLVWWLLPDGTIQKIIPSMPELKAGMEMFFISGISLISGAIWAVMYNSDIILSTVVALFGRIKGMPPMLKIAVNYPMKNRFRTGMALAMFSLIIFTMVFMSILLPAFFAIYDNVDRLSGGFDIQASTGFANPVTDISKSLDKKGEYVDKDDFDAVGGMAMAGAELRQKDAKSKKWTPYAIQGVNDGYTKHVNYRFVMRSSKYRTDTEVWKALRENKGYAVVYSSLVPAKNNMNMNEKPNFMLSGFYQEDKKLPDTYIEVKDPATGKISKLKVIGVLEMWAFYTFNSIITSQDTLKDTVTMPVVPTTFWFKVKDGVDANKAAKSLGKAFYENGMNTTLTEDSIRKTMQAQMMIDNLLQWFMGLGLVVGIAALGVIAARSVVERRQQIGMLRAIGFKRGMVQNTFILESSFVATLGIVIGVALGVGLSYNVIDYMAKEMKGLEFAMQWQSVLGIAAVSYIASLLTTYLPARQASKVYPAEALRYE